MPNNAEAPSKEEFENWKIHPVTEWFMRELASVAEDIQDRLATGGALGESAEKTAMTYSRQVGITEGVIRAITTEPPIKEALS